MKKAISLFALALLLLVSCHNGGVVARATSNNVWPQTFPSAGSAGQLWTFENTLAYGTPQYVTLRNMSSVTLLPGEPVMWSNRRIVLAETTARSAAWDTITIGTSKMETVDTLSKWGPYAYQVMWQFINTASDDTLDIWGYDAGGNFIKDTLVLASGNGPKYSTKRWSKVNFLRVRGWAANDSCWVAGYPCYPSPGVDTISADSTNQVIGVAVDTIATKKLGRICVYGITPVKVNATGTNNVGAVLVAMKARTTQAVTGTHAGKGLGFLLESGNVATTSTATCYKAFIYRQ